MSLSDDVASLKVGVHKLAVAIEELAIRKYLQGEIDISKLPWFTPQYVPGDSIKLSGSRLPTATVYSDNNEVIASPTPCFPNSSDNSLGAPKVFDQTPEPNSCSNQLKNVAAHFGGTQTPTAANLNLPCDKDANLTMVVGQLASLNAFEKDIIHGGDSQRYANGVVRVNSQCLTPNFGVDNKLSDVHEHLSDCKLIPKPQLQSAHKVLDELPLPTFIQEMAEAAKIGEIDAVQDDYEPASAVQGVQHDHFTQKHQLLAKLATLEGSHFRDLVVICANGIRFSTILHSLINGWQHSEKLLHEVNKPYDGKVNSEYQCLEVSMVSSIVSNAIPHIGLINNVVLPLLWSDSDWFMGSSLSGVLGVNVCKSKIFELRDDCRSFLNIKEVHGLEKLNHEISPDVWIVTTAPNAHEVKRMCLLNFIAIDADTVALTCSQIAWSYYISGCTRFYAHSYTGAFQEKGYYKFFDPGIRVEVSYNTTLEDKGDFRGEEDKVYSLEVLEVFDRGGECLEMICECLNYSFTSSLNSLSSKCDDGIEAKFKVFDPGPILANVATLKLIDVSNNYVLMPCDHACFSSDNKLSFQMKKYDLRGMKMIKITRLGQSYLEYGKNMLGGQSTCMYLEFTYESSTHSVGSQLGSKMYGVASHEVGFYEALIALYATIDMKSFKGPKHSSVSLVILPVTWTLLFEVICIYGWNLTHTSNYGYFTTIFFLAPANALCFLRRLLVVNFETLTLIPMVMLNLTQTGSWCAPRNLLTALWDKFSGLQLDFDIGWCSTWIEVVSYSLREAPAFISHIAPLSSTEVKVFFIFDPGGCESGLKMRIRPPVCGGKGVTIERYKDHQVYVFDPGGSSIIEVANAMRELQNLKSAMLRLCFYGVYYLSLILEDKDQFQEASIDTHQNYYEGQCSNFSFYLLTPLL